MEKDILIIGDGIQGIGVGLALSELIPREEREDRFMIVGEDGLLENWKRVTAIQGMKDLISPNFCQVGSAVYDYPRTYDSPSVKEFCDNAQLLIKRVGMDKYWQKSRASNLVVNDGAEYPFEVKLSELKESVHLKAIVLALGYGVPSIPEVFKDIEKEFPDKIMHTHNVPDNFNWKEKKVLIIGAGRSGRTLQRHICNSGGKAALLCRNKPKSSACYFDHFTDVDLVAQFRALPMEERLKQLRQHWKEKEVICDSEEYMDFPDWTLFNADIKNVMMKDEKVSLQIDYKNMDQETATAPSFDMVVLATGYSDQLIEPSLVPSETKLHTIEGQGVYPEMDEYLQINSIPGLFGVGSLSVLRQGAAARDIPSIPAHVQAIKNSPLMKSILLKPESF